MDVACYNPHYLARPGAGMPRLDELHISSSKDSDAKSAGILDETSKARLMRVFDSADDEGITPTATASPRLRSSLKPHQLTALMMMSEKELGVVENPRFPSIWERATLYDGTPTYRHRITARTDSHPYVARGGILADEMGLGKTLSILSLICWSIDSFNNNRTGEDKEQSLPTLIVTPKSMPSGKLSRDYRHILPDRIKVAVYHGSDRQVVASNFRHNEIVLTTYETMRSEFSSAGPLYIEKWFRVVLDEAHHIGNRNAMKSKAAFGIQARRRWCLTGTPVQNSLDNGALLSFIGVAPFVDKSQSDLWIANPIKEKDKRHISWNRLQLLVRVTSLRRTKKVLDHALELTTYQKKIEHIDLRQSERKLYEFFRQQTAAIASGFWQQKSNNHLFGQQKDANMLSLLNLLRLICNHEDLLPVTAARAWRAKQSEAIDWRLLESLSRTCTICKEDLEEAPGHAFESTMPKSQPVCAMCAPKGEGSDAAMTDSYLEPSAEATMETDVASTYRFGAANPSSSKIEALIRTLNREQAANQEEMVKTPIKSVIFSYWTKMLDLTQKALHTEGFYCERIYGKMSLQSRSTTIHHFGQDPSCTILLATIGSAGEGINLTVANFVHLLEPHWNPMVEAQAIARVHRIGQPKPVIATRYVTLDSIEEYVRWIQKDKLRLIARSLSSDDVSQKDLDDERWEKLQHFLGKRNNLS
ncbi:transcription termination factor 2 (SNF2 family domain-containing protein) [Colletotrichum musicola]|uniref:Transcription termination factor 2 (SNF2 family domain-containing protein) n=1 Tax=Colletotrichum musicola TaxID=2175873 RepID=A0A8H6J0E6_9PEZI|nr:transcription termination factor 2 (SNF2 family domain-containing protein) [Colletotrichum musicola]